MEASVEVEEARLDEARITVEREIQEAPFNGDTSRYLNNFECWLPNGLNRRFSEKLGDLDMTPEQDWTVAKAKLPQLPAVDFSKQSQLRLNQTTRQFYETIDKALEEEGFSLEEVKKWQYNDNFWQDMNQKTLRDRMLPVYIRLRAMGYTREDLHT